MRRNTFTISWGTCFLFKIYMLAAWRKLGSKRQSIHIRHAKDHYGFNAFGTHLHRRKKCTCLFLKCCDIERLIKKLLRCIQQTLYRKVFSITFNIKTYLHSHNSAHTRYLPSSLSFALWHLPTESRDFWPVQCLLFDWRMHWFPV